MRKQLFILIFLGCWLLIGPVSAGNGAKMLENYLRGLNSLSADFRQLTVSADGLRETEATGRFYLLRPGRFRWEYRQPTEQVIVADGRRVYVHDKELNQVTHQAQSKALDGTPAQLLASDIKLTDHFVVRDFDRGDHRVWVELEPKTSDSQMARLRIGFAGGELETVLMEDRFGQLTRVSFTNLRRNPSLPAKLFVFEQPIGGDFLQMD